MCCFDDRLSIIWPIFCLLAASSYGRHILVYLHTTSNSKRRKETTREIMHFLKLLRDCDPFCGVLKPPTKTRNFWTACKILLLCKVAILFHYKKRSQAIYCYHFDDFAQCYQIQRIFAKKSFFIFDDYQIPFLLMVTPGEA